MSKRFLSLALIVVLCLGLLPTVALAEDEITVKEDTASTYTPTQIVNGEFTSVPFVTFYYNGKKYTTIDQSIPNGSTHEGIVVNGVDAGWNTTETKIEHGNLFEHLVDYNNYTYGDGGFVELNSSNSSMLWQDLTTYGGDIIRWTLQHHSRPWWGGDPQVMHVSVGAPETSGGSIVPASGINDKIDTHIQSGTLGEYRYTGITEGSGTVAFANSGDLTNLSVAQLKDREYKYTAENWKTASGVYVVPDNQSVTRFGFIADTEGSEISGGNMLDNITFSTLLGNLSASLETNRDVVIKGYWGDSTSGKKLYVKNGDTTLSVDMSSVLNKNFIVTIPASQIGSTSNTITVYHQDYPTASRSVKVPHIHEWSYAVESGTTDTIVANCDGAPKPCDYTGKDLKVTISAENVKYDKQAHPATLKDSESAATTTIAGNTAPAIKYKNTATEEESTTAPTKVGSYRASITVKDDKAVETTVYVDYTISQNESKIETLPAANDLAYTAAEQELVTAGVAENGTLYYALGEDATTVPAADSWKTDIPKGTAAGTYYVWYKCVGDEGYKDVDPACIEMELDKANLTIANAQIGYEMNDEGIAVPKVQSVEFSGLVGGETPVKDTDYTVTAQLMDADGNPTTEFAKADKVVLTLSLCETALMANYQTTGIFEFSTDPTDKTNITLLVNITPAEVTVREGSRATFTAKVSYNQSTKQETAKSKVTSVFTYQWYVDRNDGEGPQPIKKATKATYKTGAVSLKNEGYQYSCKVTDSYGRETTSDPAVLHVEPGIPTTGDDNRPLLFAGLLLLAGAGLVVLKKRSTR